jgi:catechol 2,3-dioxygenase-like lactoylglutathione lyase family enzyme
MIKFGHIALSVSDLKRSIAFYSKHFGLRCAKKFAHKDSRLVIALLKKGDITLELFEFKEPNPLPLYRQDLNDDLHTLGVKHFSLETKNIETIYKKFKKARMVFATNLRTFDNGKRYFFIKDPDGILVEIMEL